MSIFWCMENQLLFIMGDAKASWIEQFVGDSLIFQNLLHAAVELSFLDCLLTEIIEEVNGRVFVVHHTFLPSNLHHSFLVFESEETHDHGLTPLWGAKSCKLLMHPL